MRVSRAKAEENHQTVIEVASRLFRERGFDGVGLNEVMKGAGLTQGGFYKQFQSKDDLIVQASVKALKSGADRWDDIVAKANGSPLDALVRFYLSDLHRSELAEGCTFAALGAEAARRDGPLRTAFEDGLLAHIGILEGLIEAESEPSPREKAIFALSAMIGALVLSRAVSDEHLSDQILNSVTEGLLAPSPSKNLA